MLAFAVLFGLIRMAPGAVLGGDHAGHRDTVFRTAPFGIRLFILLVMVLGHVRIMLFRFVAVNTRDIGTGMPAVRPVRKNAGMLPLMTLNTRHTGFRNASLNPEFLFLGHILLGLCRHH